VDLTLPSGTRLGHFQRRRARRSRRLATHPEPGAL